MSGAVARLFARGRALPWARIYFLGELAYRKGKAVQGGLSGAERSELGRLLKKSRGRRGNLNGREFQRLKSLALKAFEAARRA
jgi:hypothetical protein